jgi:putative transposase
MVADAELCVDKAFDLYLEKYKARYPKSCEPLRKDRAALLNFYDFPAEHWAHLRTTGHRPQVGLGSNQPSPRSASDTDEPKSAVRLAMMFKLAGPSSKKERRLRGYEQFTHVIHGKLFIDGTLQEYAACPYSHNTTFDNCLSDRRSGPIF